MNTALTSFWKLLDPVRLTGPLFGKELRVSSRRKRNYLLRFVYVIALTVFVAGVWISVVQSQVSTTFQKSRLAVAGKEIIETIVMFQFFATQLVAVIMLSTSISDEIYHRTLGLLMTTPISSFQIVMGKLCSKLLQLMLLLGISLPLLAVVRIFGGVPWGYVLSSLCITITAVIFAGALSLFLKTIFIHSVIFALLPAMMGLLGLPILLSVPRSVVVYTANLYLNPFKAIVVVGNIASRGAGAFYWPVHCAIMLGLSAVLIALCSAVVRKVALRQAVGQIEDGSRPKRRRTAAKKIAHNAQAIGIVRRVTGSPVAWKDLRAPLIQGADGRNSMIGLIVTVTALLITYGLWARKGYLDADFTHVSYTCLFVFVAMILHIVFSATSITLEKESRTWPILLATPMDDWRILSGKAAAVFRRCMPVWLILAGHVILFVLAGYIHPVAIVHLSMLVLWLVVFLTCSGLYFSALFRRTTSAVVASFALAIVLWVVMPTGLALVSDVTRDERILAASAMANPAIQAGVIVHAATGRYNADRSLGSLEYEWMRQDLKIGPTTVILLISMLAYVFCGFLFAWRAKCRLRRNVF